MRVQKHYIDAASAQVTTPGLFGGFSFRDFKKLKGGDSWIHSTAQRKEHSKMEFGEKNSEKKFGESETFYRSKFGRATGVKFSISSLLSSTERPVIRFYTDRAVPPDPINHLCSPTGKEISEN